MRLLGGPLEPLVSIDRCAVQNLLRSACHGDDLLSSISFARGMIRRWDLETWRVDVAITVRHVCGTHPELTRSFGGTLR